MKHIVEEFSMEELKNLYDKGLLNFHMSKISKGTKLNKNTVIKIIDNSRSVLVGSRTQVVEFLKEEAK